MFILQKRLLILVIALPCVLCMHAVDNFDITTTVLVNNRTIKASYNLMIDATSVSGTGTIRAASVRIKCDDLLSCQGTIEGKQRTELRAQRIEGSGTISGTNVFIMCDEFDFTGAIFCEKECTIYTKKMFKSSQFTRKGGGRFTVIVTNHPIELIDQKTMVEQVSEFFRDCAVNLPARGIDKKISKTRTEAVLNRISDTDILEQISKEMEAEALCYKNMVHLKRDNAALGMLVAKLGAGALGLSLSYALFNKRERIADRFDIRSHKDKAGLIKIALGGGIISLIPLGLASSSFSAWLYPQYKEKYEKYSLIVSRIEHALKTPRLAEETIMVLS